MDKFAYDQYVNKYPFGGYWEKHMIIYSLINKGYYLLFEGKVITYLQHLSCTFSCSDSRRITGLSEQCKKTSIVQMFFFITCCSNTI